MNNGSLLPAASGDWSAALQEFETSRRQIRQFEEQVLPGLSQPEQIAFFDRAEGENLHAALSLGLLRREDSQARNLRPVGCSTARGWPMKCLPSGAMGPPLKIEIQPKAWLPTRPVSYWMSRGSGLPWSRKSPTGCPRQASRKGAAPRSPAGGVAGPTRAGRGEACRGEGLGRTGQRPPLVGPRRGADRHRAVRRSQLCR